MSETKVHPATRQPEKKGGYPAGDKPANQIKPPPATVTKPKEKRPPR